MFLIAAACAAFLLHRHAEWVPVAGEVEARRVVVSSPTTGVLAPIGMEIGRLKRVRQGDVIARVESESLMASPDNRREVNRLRGDLKATLAAEIHAPMSGCVTEVYLQPGQLVQPGQPILELAEEEGSHIIAYIRKNQHIRPVAGMVVQVHLASDPGRIYESYVEAVGVRMERLPEHLLSDHKTPEWGLPVRLAMPPAAGLRPGESVDIVFKPANVSEQMPVRVPSTKTLPTPKRNRWPHLAMARAALFGVDASPIQ
ncbi:MAG: biotin/lipoyl-binding protein [Bacillota bacterium]